MKAIAYVRVSRTNGREGPSFISPAQQRKAIARWATLHGHQVVQTFEELDQPGSKIDRPKLGEAMAMVEAGGAEAIIVAKLDRFARSALHLAQLVERLSEAGAALVSVQDGIDTSGGTGRMVAGILSNVAEWELDRIREGWSVARTNALERGVWLGGAVPFGYRKRKNGQLEPDPKTAPLAVKVFEKRSNGESWASLCHWLEGKGAKTPQGNAHWSVQTVKWIVGNRAYLGEVSTNGHTNTEAHTALVSPDQFKRANRHRRKARKPSGAATGLLSGILRCAGCRYAMKCSVHTDRHNNRSQEYRCKSRAKGAGSDCQSSATIRASAIEPYVEDFVRSVLDGARIGATKLTSEVDEARGALEAAESDLRAWEEASKGLPTELVREGLQARIRAVEAAEEGLSAAEDRVELADLPVTDDWSSKSLEEKREAIVAALDSVFVWRTPNPGREHVAVEDRVAIYPAGEGPSDLPSKGKRWQAKPLPVPN